MLKQKKGFLLAAISAAAFAVLMTYLIVSDLHLAGPY